MGRLTTIATYPTSPTSSIRRRCLVRFPVVALGLRDPPSLPSHPLAPPAPTVSAFSAHKQPSAPNCLPVGMTPLLQHMVKQTKEIIEATKEDKK